jgi:deoxyribodipyrimidine photo-lyase
MKLYHYHYHINGLCVGGSDSNPFFRIFNPWRQTEEHDANCEYIKKWIPELSKVPIKDILKWETEWMNYKDCGYVKPMVNYLIQKEVVLEMLYNRFRLL